MGQSADAVVIAASGAVNVAPVGTTLPIDESEALDPGFVDLGYTSPDGATFTDSKTKEPIPAWQSLYPVKYTVTDASAMVAFALRQWDRDTIPLAFGGGTVETVSIGKYAYTPPDASQIDERALVLSWQQDAYTFRLVVPRLISTEAVETNLTRTTAADLPLTLSIIATSGVPPWQLLSDHPEWAPAV